MTAREVAGWRDHLAATAVRMLADGSPPRPFRPVQDRSSADAVGTILAMPDELSVDVFTELGRVTWAAIKLEDYVEGLCSHIDPANPRTDRRQVSTKIRDAQRVLAARARSATRDEAAR